MDPHVQAETIRHCIKALDKAQRLLTGSYPGAPEKPPLKNRAADARYILKNCGLVLVDVEITLAQYLQEGKE